MLANLLLGLRAIFIRRLVIRLVNAPGLNSPAFVAKLCSNAMSRVFVLLARREVPGGLRVWHTHESHERQCRLSARPFEKEARTNVLPSHVISPCLKEDLSLQTPGLSLRRRHARPESWTLPTKKSTSFISMPFTWTCFALTSSTLLDVGWSCWPVPLSFFLSR